MSFEEGLEKLRAIGRQMREDVESDRAPTPTTLTVREFIAWFGYVQRSQWLITNVQECLDECNLRIRPDLWVSYIDEDITIEYDANEAAGAESQTPAYDPTLRLSVVEGAHRKPLTVAPDDPLSKALTLMRMNNIGHVPVAINEREVKGVVTWRAIAARASESNDNPPVRDVMDKSFAELDIHTPLFRAAETIGRNGFVLVRDRDGTVSGIVTANDMALNYAQISRPFLMAGEIEGYLRRLIRRKFTREELKSAKHGPSGKSQVGPVDLTLGDYVALLGKQEYWDRLGLTGIDRGEFIKRLDWCRQKRNEIMHFNPDGLDPEDVEGIANMVEFFRTLA